MPARLGPFQVVTPLAAGGMGEVWRAEHLRQRIPVAIKLLRGDDARLRDAFFAEVRAVARLDHPGVILVLDHGVVDADAETASAGRLRAGTPWFAMELCSGGTLKHAVATSWTQLRGLLLALLAPLGHAHARGVLHRDITPDNVLFGAPDDARPGVKLTDFGLAFALEVEGRNRTVVTGTPAYMAPEQFRRAWRDYGPWTDLYALGCLAWRLATGDAPFGSRRTPEVLAVAHAELELPAFVPRFDVPPGFRDWLGRLLEKDPARRLQRAGDAAAALLTLDGTREPGGLVPMDWRAGAPPRAPMRLVGAGLGLWSVRTLPLVGREAERDRLWEAFREVHETWSARVVLLHGAAGTGTSRLAEWLAERAHEAGGAEVFHVEHARDGDPTSALAALVARHLGVEGLEPDAVRARARQWLRARGVVDPAEAVALGALLAPAPDDPVAPPSERHALVRRVLERAAAARSVVVRLDDVQWGGDALAFAAEVLRAQASSPAPILLVLTAQAEALAERPVEALQLSELTGMGAVATWLEVRPLAEADQVALVEGLLGLGGALADQVRTRSGGNPAFAVRLVGDWVARGILEVADDGFVLRPGARAELPDDLHAAWDARLERALGTLGPRASVGRRCLEVAAALGPEVDEGEWVAACGTAGLKIPDGLVERLVLERLVSPVERDGEELVWTFSHGMLRESVERGAAEGGRLGEAHRACASVLLDRRGPGVAERIGRHLLAAGAHADALGFLLHGARERDARAEFRAGYALLVAREDALRALDLPVADVRWGEGRLLQAWLHLRQGQPLEAERRAASVLSDTRRSGWAALLPEALLLSAEVARARGAPSRALELYQQARVLYVRLLDDRGAAACLFGVGALALQMGEGQRAVRLLQQAQAVFGRVADDRRYGDCLRLRAEAARRAGNLPSALALADEAQAVFGRLGNRVAQAEAVFTRAEIARSSGALEDAVAGYRAAVRVLEAAGSEDVGLVLARLGLALDLRDRPNDARVVLDAARAHAERHEDRGLLGLVFAIRAPIDAALGQLPAFDAHLERASVLFAATGRVDPDAAEALERAARRLPDPARAAAARALAARLWQSLGRPDRASPTPL